MLNIILSTDRHARQLWLFLCLITGCPGAAEEKSMFAFREKTIPQQLIDYDRIIQAEVRI